MLCPRSGKSKTTKNSNESEYRTILDNLISDLLTVLYWPEWPAASLLLGIVCKYMVSCVRFKRWHRILIILTQVSSLDDVKTTNQTDNNATKNIALDHLGVIAARIRSSVLKTSSGDPESGHLDLHSLDNASA
jgi:cohesin loading factor subunit SCC2